MLHPYIPSLVFSNGIFSKCQHIHKYIIFILLAMQADLLTEIIEKENSNQISKQDFGKEFADTSEFDFWVTSPSNSTFFSTGNPLSDDEKITKFFKLQIFHSNTLKVNSEELLNKCISILRTQNLSEQNQILFLKLLSNLSTSHPSADIIRSTGLVEWVEQHSHNDSPKFFLESWKILQNLSAHVTNSPIYLDGVYPFNPPWKAQKPIADVILVHGIKGGAAWTWRQHDVQREKKPVLTQQQRQELLSCQTVNQLLNQNLSDETYTWIWPLDWLSQRIKQPFRIIAVDYPAHWWQWFDGESQKRDLAILSEEILLKLKVSGVGSRPIIWIAHSMGGILVKKMFQQETSREKTDNASHSLLSSTRAVVFLSVPHFGSPLASWSCSVAPLLRPSPYIYHMKADCPHLLKIHQDFVDFCERNSVQVLTLNENQPCKITRSGPNFTFVPSKYGNPGIGEFYEVDASHLDICKPKGRSDKKFKLIENFLLKIFENLTYR